MFDWLGDHWEFVVGTAIGLPGLVALYYQRRPNTLDYQVTHTAPLLSKHNSILNVPLTVNYLGNPMKNPYLLRLRILNSGKHAVTADDYAKPITIEVEGAAVYDVSVPEMSPTDLIDLFEDSVHPEGKPGPLSTYGFRPKLLNPGDWFDVQQLLEGKPSAVKVSTRYASQSRPMDDAVRRSQNHRVIGLVLFHWACVLTVTVLTILREFHNVIWGMALSLSVLLSLVMLPSYIEYIGMRLRRGIRRQRQ